MQCWSSCGFSTKVNSKLGIHACTCITKAYLPAKKKKLKNAYTIKNSPPVITYHHLLGENSGIWINKALLWLSELRHMHLWGFLLVGADDLSINISIWGLQHLHVVFRDEAPLSLQLALQPAWLSRLDHCRRGHIVNTWGQHHGVGEGGGQTEDAEPPVSMCRC